MDESNNDTPDFEGALAAEFGFTPEPTDTTPPAPAPAGDEAPASEAEPKPSTAVTEEQVPPTEAPQPKEGEPATPQDGTPAPKADDKPADAPQPVTKDDIKAAIREYNQDTDGRVNQIHEASQEVIKSLHPEGIDQNVYDSNGNVIKTAQDIVDRGLVKDNGEPFTYEEAASFMLEAGRQASENMEKLQKYAEEVAEKNISLVESNQRVMDKWGETLKAMPQLASQLAEKYITTQLEFDPTGNYITKMAMSPEDFYSIVMQPYSQLGQTIAEKQALEAAQQQRQQQAEQAERSGLPPQRGTSATKPNTGDPMLDALVEELNKG